MLRAPERAACTVMPESCWKSHLPTATIHGDERNSECCCCRPIWGGADGIVGFLLEPHVHSSVEMYKRGGESVWPWSGQWTPCTHAFSCPGMGPPAWGVGVPVCESEMSVTM